MTDLTVPKTVVVGRMNVEMLERMLKEGVMNHLSPLKMKKTRIA
jgi:hypothetical protein